MTREKVKQEYITDDSKRRISFRKRRGSIMKKIRELSILCGVEAGAIVYSGPSDPQPEVWPDTRGVQQVIERYQAKPVSEKTLNQEGLIQQRVNKGKELLKKRRKENHEEEISQLMLKCMGGLARPNTVEDAMDMKTMVEQRLKDINRMIEASGKEVEVYDPAPLLSEGLIHRDNEKSTDQVLQFGMGSDKEVEVYVPVMPTSVHVQAPPTPVYVPAPQTSDYVPAVPTSDELTDQNLQYGMDSDNLINPPWWKDIENMEDYMGVGAYNKPLPFSNLNYPNASSSYNPFSP